MGRPISVLQSERSPALDESPMIFTASTPMASRRPHSADFANPHRGDCTGDANYRHQRDTEKSESAKFHACVRFQSPNKIERACGNEQQSNC